ncbi:hypothetical protein SK128_006624 [Halocaridina rubra]|uniref:Uncharacterized protein n=1 Tax=Halocaridina rubra TaxID=373956 RepID=A0AAN8XJ81_HALRR
MLTPQLAVVWFLYVVRCHGSPLRQTINCGGQAFLNFGRTEYFASPNYPSPYGRGLHCHWMAVSPYFTAMKLKCETFNTASSEDCSVDSFYFSKVGDFFMRDGKIYCGTGSLEVTTNANYFSVRFLSQNSHPNTHTGFQCSVTVVLPDGGKEISIPNTIPPSKPAPIISPPAPQSSSCECGVKGPSRIVGGQESGINEWPWQVGLEYVPNMAIICGATLISTQWVLTAAHCVQQFAIQDLKLRLGEHDKTSNHESAYTIEKTIEHVVIHPEFDALSIDNNIALLKMDTPVTLNDGIRPICLPFSYVSENLSGQVGTVTGWGTTQFEGNLSNVLREVEVPILTTSECMQYTFNTITITDNMICTYEEGKDACQGDSGGPLQWKKNNRWYLMGLVSMGEGCANVNSPGVYSKITNYLNWIQQQTAVPFCSPA